MELNFLFFIVLKCLFNNNEFIFNIFFLKMIFEVIIDLYELS